jgi:hypothetical protein
MGSEPSRGIFDPLSCASLFSSPAMAKDWPSRSSTSVAARRVDSAGIRKPASCRPFAKSRVLTSGWTFSRIMSPVMVGTNLSLTPNSFHWMLTVAAAPSPCAIGTGNSPPARKLASCPL